MLIILQQKNRINWQVRMYPYKPKEPYESFQMNRTDTFYGSDNIHHPEHNSFRPPQMNPSEFKMNKPSKSTLLNCSLPIAQYELKQPSQTSCLVMNHAPITAFNSNIKQRSYKTSFTPYNEVSHQKEYDPYEKYESRAQILTDKENTKLNIHHQEYQDTYLHTIGNQKLHQSEVSQLTERILRKTNANIGSKDYDGYNQKTKRTHYRVYSGLEKETKNSPNREEKASKFGNRSRIKPTGNQKFGEADTQNEFQDFSKTATEALPTNYKLPHMANSAIGPYTKKDQSFIFTRKHHLDSNDKSRSKNKYSAKKLDEKKKKQYRTNIEISESRPLKRPETAKNTEHKTALSIYDFQFGPCKGEGRFGQVFIAVHRKTNFLCAIKKIKKEAIKYMLDQFLQELKLNLVLNHSNIAKTYGFCTDYNHIYMIMEYMEQGSLFTFIKLNTKLSEEQASKKLNDVCMAIKQLHQNGIIHRDIKPQNIVITNNCCKLCDFGWAVYSEERRTTCCGTLDYLCPEIVEGEEYDNCVDIWAIGVLAFQMLTGKAPFYNISRKETMKKIRSCEFSLPESMSKRAQNFIKKALRKNPDERTSIEDLCRDPFLLQYMETQ